MTESSDTAGSRGDGAAEMAALMERYCDGDARAFQALYAELAPRILGYLIGLARERATAEDLLQLTFMKIHQARSAYVRGANPVPWVYTIAHRTCLDELRRRKRAKVRISADGNLPHEPAVDITGSAEPPSSGEDAEAIARGLAALATLPEPQRQAVLLMKIHGHSSAQAASIAGTSVGAIKLRAHRGYVALRRKLSAIGRGRSPGLAGAPAEVAMEQLPP
jgi:RNA polymerase sigma-70 factor (ECF subfamily)